MTSAFVSSVLPVLVAFRNMLIAARRDPIWAIWKVVFSSWRVIPYVGFNVFVAMVFYVILFFSVIGLLRTVGFEGKDGIGLVVGYGVSILLGIPPVVVLFRMLAMPLLLHFGEVEADTHGSARFATKEEIAPLTRSTSGLLLGEDAHSDQFIRYDGPAHCLTIAPTRSGKGVGTVIPNLLTLDRPVICIDPKGENARIAGRARQGFGPVHILDPFGVTGQPSAAFNPLARLDITSLDIAEDTATLADALVTDPPGEAGEAHWNEEAKALIAGLLLYIVAEEPLERRNLATLREHLTLAPDAFDALLVRMQACAAAGGLIARAANRHLSKSAREAAGVLSSAQRHTHFLDSPRISAVLGRSDFAFADLATGAATVFLVLPPDRLSTYARWLRLLIAQSLTELTRLPAPPERPILYLLDEFAALGHLAPVERAFGLMAGYGLQFWPILQDIHQLRAAYGPKAGTFLSNAGVLQVFGVNDNDSARVVSDLLGQGTVVFRTESRALDSEETGLTFSEQHVARPLLTPDEVRALPAHAELLFLSGQRPIMARKLRYYTDRRFAGLFDTV